MLRILSLGTFTVLCSLMCVVKCKEDQCRQLEFSAALAFRGKRLLNHKIKEIDNVAKDFCGALCFTESNCVSYNILVSNDSPSLTKCEMNNATHFEQPSDLVSFPNSTYRGSKNVCIKKPCPSNAICQAGFSSEGYRCVCVPGYTGEDCREADGCYNYSILNDSNRKSSYVTPQGSEVCGNLLPKGWYRFVGAAGTKMPTTRVPAFRCGTDWSGWLDGAHPTAEDGDVRMYVCGSDRSAGCKHRVQISV